MFVIDEFGEVWELSIVDNNGIDWTIDFIGNYGVFDLDIENGGIVYDGIEDEWQAKKETCLWWYVACKIVQNDQTISDNELSDKVDAVLKNRGFK